MRANDGTGQRGHVTPKHVQVDGKHPGLLMDWRAVDGKREASVIWTDSDQLPARAHLEWLPEDRVSPPDVRSTLNVSGPRHGEVTRARST